MRDFPHTRGTLRRTIKLTVLWVSLLCQRLPTRHTRTKEAYSRQTYIWESAKSWQEFCCLLLRTCFRKSKLSKTIWGIWKSWKLLQQPLKVVTRSRRLPWSHWLGQPCTTPTRRCSYQLLEEVWWHKRLSQPLKDFHNLCKLVREALLSRLPKRARVQGLHRNLGRQRRLSNLRSAESLATIQGVAPNH